MVEEVAGRRVSHGEVHGEGAEAAVGGQPEGRVLVEDLPVEVDADVGLHVLGRKVQNLESAGKFESEWMYCDGNPNANAPETKC